MIAHKKLETDKETDIVIHECLLLVLVWTQSLESHGCWSESLTAHKKLKIKIMKQTFVYETNRKKEWNTNIAVVRLKRNCIEDISVQRRLKK